MKIYIETENGVIEKKRVKSKERAYSYDYLMKLEKQYGKDMRVYYIGKIKRYFPSRGWVEVEDEIQIYGSDPYKELANQLTFYGI